MKILSDVRLYFVIVTILFLSLLVNYLNMKDELSKYKTELSKNVEKVEMQQTIDSLQSELFIKSIEIGRYEIAFEIFKEKNKSCSEEFDLILTTQTE